MFDTSIRADLNVSAARRGTMLDTSVGALRARSEPLSDNRTIYFIRICTARHGGLGTGPGNC